MITESIKKCVFLTATVISVTTFSSSSQAQSIWAGLPNQSPSVTDFANWMTSEKATAFSGFRHSKCPSNAVDQYYNGSLALCNAYQTYYEQSIDDINRENTRLDRIIECKRSGYKYCY